MGVGADDTSKDRTVPDYAAPLPIPQLLTSGRFPRTGIPGTGRTAFRRGFASGTLDPLRLPIPVLTKALPVAQLPSQTPARIFEALNAFQRSAALKAAIDLDLFTHLGRRSATAEELSQACGGQLRAVRILCDYLTVHGFLQKTGTQYQSAPDAALFLDRNSPAFFGSVTAFLHSSPLTDAFRDITTTVRQGHTQLPGSGTVEPNFAGWVDFARSMVPMMRGPAGFLGPLAARLRPGAVRVLDLAAGHGLFGIAVAQHNPEASITALDWAPVLEVARENALAAGVGERHTLRPGDALQVDLGGPYELILVTNFLHHFSRETNVHLLQRLAAALAPGGLILTLEFIPNADRISPPMPAEFALTMLATTAEGDAYTFEEYAGMFEAAGLAQNEMLDVPASTQRLIISGR